MYKRLSFNEDELNYDKYRPNYCSELFNDIIKYSSLDNNKTSLEIGIGTGQATTPFLNTGCFLKAIELGHKLAEFSKNKFSKFNNINIENISFEAFKHLPKSFDLVYSATAFHWIDEKIAYPKAFDMLKSGGTLALFWNRPYVARENDLLHKEIQSIYSKYRPSNNKIIEIDTEKYQKRIETIKKYGFENIEFKLYHQTRQFNAEDYIGLLNTYSDHRSMPIKTKKLLESEIFTTIKNFDDKLYIYDTIDLYLAKKS